jgi:hypothetical protein
MEAVGRLYAFMQSSSCCVPAAAHAFGIHSLRRTGKADGLMPCYSAFQTQSKYREKGISGGSKLQSPYTDSESSALLAKSPDDTGAMCVRLNFVVCS